MATIAVTGAGGFIGQNLVVRLEELGHSIRAIGHDIEVDAMAEKLRGADFLFHLAGVNRPPSVSEFYTGNVGLLSKLVDAISRLDRPIPVLYSSSVQAELDNPYGRSKRAAEDMLVAYGKSTGAHVHLWRLPNVFGKWSRPNYNSVVATFCHNIANGLPITIDDPVGVLRLVYIDDVVDAMIAVLDNRGEMASVGPVYEVTLGDLAARIEAFRDSRATLTTGPVGSGLDRALHATYLSFLRPPNFSYPLTAHSDPRGTFAEVLRTPDAGQFSFFTALPGVTRGGHYHHSKTERFIIVHGQARFGFRHIRTNETFTLETSSERPQVVETVPGWAHNITNIGQETLIVMLWANEVFDAGRPDTVAARVLT